MRFSLTPRPGLIQVITLATLLFTFIAHSLPTDASALDTNGTTPAVAAAPQLEKRAPDFYLRILPLGASIVYGMGSSNGNGFRKYLRDTLRQSGYKVNMVGNRNAGDMLDNACEATSGFHVHQVHAAALTSTKYKPNVILLNAGNNDAREHNDVVNIETRMNALLDDLYREIPGVTILLSTLIPTTNAEVLKEWNLVNMQYHHIAAHRRYVQGQKMILVDFEKPGEEWNIPTSMIPDGIHPNDEGYALMASAWFRGIMEADHAGFLSAPEHVDFVNDDGGSEGNTCDKKYGVARGPVQTQAGSGLEDGTYTHGSTPRGVRHTLTTKSEANPFLFARLSSDTDRHYIIEVTSDTDSTRGGRYYNFWRPSGPGSWESQAVRFWVPNGCIKRGVRWADINGDGRDDMLCISPNGDVYYSVNWALDHPMPPPYPMGAVTLWKTNEGYPQDRVRLADIDGDGRVDYCVLHDNGNIRCWRNGGQGDGPEYWQDLGIVFTGKGMGDINGVRFYDINGDGRDDWLWMDNTGKTHTWVNNRGCEKGREGQGLTPHWRAANNNPTHYGLSIDGIRDQIHFANVYDSPSHFGGLPRGDYVRIEPKGKDGNNYKFDFSVWQNNGGGGTKLRGDGTRHCNMMGHANGAQDLVWVHSTGYMRIYESRGGTFPDQPPYWSWNYIMWDITGERQLDRRDLHLADWDGDGLCDIIWVDNDSPRIDVWINKYKQNKNFDTWEHRPNVQPRGVLSCPRRGRGIFDLGTRFADIDGNGMADMICLEKNGRAFGYLNTDGGKTLTFHTQFKFSEGKDRANLRFTDVNGDGRADMLWIDKFNGDTTVWYNMGPIPASGSSFTWHNQGKLYQGAVQGSCTMYPDLDGNSRADMTAVDAITNQATTWFNDCGDRGGDDPNTHSGRAVIPAPGTDKQIEFILGARWKNIQYHDNPYSEPLEYSEMKDHAMSINWDKSCLDNNRYMYLVHEGWQQMWELISHNQYKLRNGEYSFTDEVASAFWGNPDRGMFTPQYQATVLSILWEMNNYGPKPDGKRPKLNIACQVDSCLRENGAPGAYAKNVDPRFPDGRGSMTFCSYYFDREKNLYDALRLSSLDIDKYMNKGTMWFHELLHLHQVSLAGKYGPNGDVTDVPFLLPDTPEDASPPRAYGGTGAKLLKNYGDAKGEIHVHRNSDSYMLSTLGSYLREHHYLKKFPPEPIVSGRPLVVLNYDRRRRAGQGADTEAPAITVDGVGTFYPNGTADSRALQDAADDYHYAVQPLDDLPEDEIVRITYDDLAASALDEERFAEEEAYHAEQLRLWEEARAAAEAAETAAASPAEEDEVADVVLPSGEVHIQVAKPTAEVAELHCIVGDTEVDCNAG